MLLLFYRGIRAYQDPEVLRQAREASKATGVVSCAGLVRPTAFVANPHPARLPGGAEERERSSSARGVGRRVAAKRPLALGVCPAAQDES